MIKEERRWKLANPSLLLRSHYDYKERGKSALWVSAAIWCIHLAAHPTWELSLNGWIYLSHWLGLRWINCLHGGTEMETTWQDKNSHLGLNARTWSKAHQIKPGGKACGSCRPLAQRNDMVTEMELLYCGQARWPRDHLDIEISSRH